MTGIGSSTDIPGKKKKMLSHRGHREHRDIEAEIKKGRAFKEEVPSPLEGEDFMPLSILKTSVTSVTSGAIIV